MEHSNGIRTKRQNLERSRNLPKTGFSIADFFGVCSRTELEWFIQEASEYFAGRLENTEDHQEPQAFCRELYLANIQIDRGRRGIFWPRLNMATTAELSQFLAGFILLSLDNAANTKGKVRSQFTVRKAAANVKLMLYDSLKGKKSFERLEYSLSMIPAALKLKNDLDLEITEGGVRLRGEMTALFMSLCDPFYIDITGVNSPAALRLPQGKCITRPPRTLRSFNKISSTLVIPSAGRSSRFPGHKPKWLLTMPNGRLMVVDAMAKLNLARVHRIVLGVLKEHVDRYCGSDVSSLMQAFEDGPFRGCRH